MIQIEREKLEKVLESLENNKKNHHYCEDTWYSCPKHEEGCANEAEGDECNCGADEINAQFDEAITIIKDVLACKYGNEPKSCTSNPMDCQCAIDAAQKDSEPVAWLSIDSIGERYLCFDKPLDNDSVQPLYIKEQL